MLGLYFVSGYDLLFWNIFVLTIRSEQMAVLDELAMASFHESVVAYLHRTVPAVCGRMTDRHILHSVVYAIATCRSYGFVRQVDILRYINLMYVFGFGFDCDPKYPWAAQILKEESMSPAARLNWLCSRALYEASRSEVLHV